MVGFTPRHIVVVDGVGELRCLLRLRRSGRRTRRRLCARWRVPGRTRRRMRAFTSRLWARRGARPRVVRDHRYGYRYLFGAACGARGKAVGLVSERADMAATNAHPEAIGAAIAPGGIGVVALDRAGWRRSRALAPPANLVLLELPPCSPALNPMETVFRYPGGDRLANRAFADAAAVAEACRKAWDWFAALPAGIASIMRREWADLPALAQASHNGWLRIWIGITSYSAPWIGYDGRDGRIPASLTNRRLRPKFQMRSPWRCHDSPLQSPSGTLPYEA